MSLRFWLPLTKDLKNQGLSSIIPTQTSGFTKITAGKLGECYKFTNVFDTLLPLSEWDWTTQSVSFGCWAKISKTELSTLAEVPSYSSTYTTMGGTLLGRDSYGGIAIRWQTNNIYTDTVLNKLYVYTHIRNTNSQTNQTSSQEVPFDTWFHIMTVIDRNDSQIKLYLNGELAKSIALTVTGTFATGTFRIAEATWHGGNGNISSGCWQLNDVRVYNHALSPLEVKHIAQGLILHYPLNRNGWGQENNIAVSKVANRSCTNFTYDPSTQEWTMTCPAASSVWGYGIAINDRNIKWAINQTWVISMEVYVPHSITWNCDINNKPDLTDISEYTGNDYDVAGQRLVCTNGIKGSKTLQAGWNKIWFSQTANTTYGLTNYSTNWGIQTTNESSDIDIKIRKIKGEVIASGLPIQPTSWCPNSSDALATTMGLNDNVEYDVSGYCNNGTRTGVFSWTGDTPKYQISTYFADGSTSYITASVFMPTDKITTSVWFKGDGSTSGANSFHIPFCLGSGTAEFSVDNAKLYRQGYYINGTRYCDTISGAIVNDGQWHMMTATYDGTILCRYLDGQLINSKSISGTLNGGMLSLLIGKYYQGGYNNKKVKQSDVRIYATALSAEDVKDLYELGATIDTNGVLSTYEFAEQ